MEQETDNEIIQENQISSNIENFLAKYESQNIIVNPHEMTNYQHVVEILDKIKPFKNLTISIGLFKG